MNQPLLTGKPGGSSLLVRALIVIAGLGLLALGIAFSIVFLAVGFVVLAVVAAQVLWKTRHLRKQMREHVEQTREQHAPAAPTRGRVIEGEAVRTEDSRPQL
jgi:membrane protein implicated in regulation of membrane protease activity